MEKIISFFKNKFYWILLLLLAVTFFLGTSSYNYFSQTEDYIKWGSPDESANYVFTKLYGQTDDMILNEKYNIPVGDIMHPRSMRSDYGRIKPVSFLGIIIIYGSLVKVTTYKIIPYLTPIIASIGLIYYYLFVRRIFGKSVAFTSVLLLSFFPVYVYYSARSMFHNVLFMVLLLIGLFYATKIISVKYNSKTNKTKSENKDTLTLPLIIRAINFLKSLVGLKTNKNNNSIKPSRIKYFQKYLIFIYPLLSGYFIGLAIVTRTSELIWVAPLLFLLWIFNIRKIGLINTSIFLLAMYAALLPMFYFNVYLYDSPFRGGYVEMNNSLNSIASAGSDLAKVAVTGKFGGAYEYAKNLWNGFFFFGFHPRQSIDMFYYYFIKMFPFLFYSSLFGFLFFIQKMVFGKRKKYLLYLSSLILISLILVFYYGSWKFNDNPDPNSYTIGNSYTRYWLPIYLGFIPFAAYFINRFTHAFLPEKGIYSVKNDNKIKFYSNIMGKKFYLYSLRIVVLLFLASWSLNFILVGSEEGLIESVQKQKDAAVELQKVLDLTESNSVIITTYHDKVLFPERKVVVGLFDDRNMLRRYQIIANLLPLYYYNFSLRDQDIEYLNSRRLKEYDLSIKEIQKVSQNFTLYQIYNFASTSAPEISLK